MSYSNFSFATAKNLFQLETVENTLAIAEVDIETERIADLVRTINNNLAIAIANGTEKARSEMIIAPILLQVRMLLNCEISLFSGTEFNVESELGLTGVCDYLLSLSPEQYVVEAPVLVVVEAKKGDLNAGMGQVVAEMVAAQRFNRQHQQEIERIYGCITSGTQWKFLKLEERTLTIDPVERSLEPLETLVGSLVEIFR